MNRREARRLALLVIADEIGRALDISDEWHRHPETDAPVSMKDAEKVKSEARLFLDALEVRIGRTQ